MRAINLINGLSLGEFIKSNQFSVPWYQREYSWTIDQLNDYYYDIVRSKEEDSQHFFGVIMTMPMKNSNIKRIIDGQQRITTTLLLFKAIKDIINENDLENTNRISEHSHNIDKFIFNYVEFSDTDSQSIRLKPSSVNEDTFNLIFSNKSIGQKKKSFNKNRKILKTNKFLFDAYKFFISKINDQIRIKSDNNTETNLKDVNTIANYFQEILRHISSNFIILPISVESQLFAYKFFQTVNDRGAKLTISDILKAYFFELSEDDKKKRNKINTKWNSFLKKIENINIDTFLRHYWASTRGPVQDKYLLDNIQKEFHSFDKVLNFLDNIIEEGSYYQMLGNQEISGEKEKELLENIFLLAKMQVLPTVLPAIIYMNPNDFATFLKMLTTFVFRYRTIAHKENKVMEKLFSEISIKIRQEEGKDVLPYIKQKLSENDIDDKLFEITFKNYETKKNRIAKYILEKIELHKREGHEEWDKKMSVEHILPKSYETNWKKFCNDNNFNPDEFIHRIGNLTLVTKPLNSKIKNAFFDKKKKEITEYSNYKINKTFSRIRKWDHKAITKRQSDFSKIVNDIWHLNHFSV